MSDQTHPERIKAIVRGEYAQAALQAKRGGSSCCSTVSSLVKLDPITSRLYDERELGILPVEAAAAATRPRWRSSTPAKWCWTWAQAAGSMCCSRPGA